MSHATAQKVEAGSQFDAKKDPEPKTGPRPLSREPVIPVEATKADKKTVTDHEYAQHYVDAVEHRNKAKAARDTPRGNSERTEKTPNVSFDGNLNLGSSRKDIKTRDVVEKTVLGDDRVVEKTSSKNRDMGVVLSGNGATGSYGRGKTDESGKTTRTGGTLGYDHSTKQVSMGGSHDITDKEGNSKGSFGAKLNIGRDSISGELSGGYGPLKASVSGGVKFEVSEPKKVGNKFHVSWQRSKEGGGSLGLSGSKGGISGGINESEYEKGVRVFATIDEANAFKENPKGMLASYLPPPTSLMGAQMMGVGEERAMGSETTGSGKASGKIMALEVGVGGSEAEGRELAIKRTSEKHFEVTATYSESDDYNVFGGGYGVTAKAGKKTASKRMVTYRFDLTDPNGIRAYELFNATRIPSMGAVLVSIQSNDGKENYDGLETPIGNATFSGYQTEQTILDEKGKHEEYVGGKKAVITPNFLGKFLGDKESTKIFELYGNQEDDKTSSYTVKGTFSGESGKSNRDGIYQLTGRDSPDRDVNEQSKSSGTWNVTTELKVEDVETFMRHMKTGRGELPELLRAAKDNDDKMRALTDFIARRGHRGLEMLFNHDQKFDVELEGDANFPGKAGREALEAKMAAYEKDIAKAGSFDSIQNDMNDLVVRRQAVSDKKKYNDLPDEMRRDEIAKINAMLAQLMSLRDRAAIEAGKNLPGEDLNGLMQRQSLEEQYDLLPTDPEQRAVHLIKDEVAEAQMRLSALEAQNAAIKAGLLAERNGGDAATLRAIRDAVGAATKAEAKSDSLDEAVMLARLDFVRSIGGASGATVGAGEKLLAQIEAQMEHARVAEAQLARFSSYVIADRSEQEDRQEARREVTPRTSMALEEEIEMPAMDARRPKAANKKK